MHETDAHPPVYLDNAASTPLHPVLLEQLPAIHRSAYANAGAAHGLGVAARRAINAAEEELRELLLLPPDTRLVWTSGGTEANNLALWGTLSGVQRPAIAVTTTVEHPSVDATLEALAGRRGFELRRVAVGRDGVVDRAALTDALARQPALLSVCHIQNETGTRQDLVAIRALLDRYAPRALFHVDGVQALGKQAIPWREARIDLLSVSGHKFHGPPGVGCLVARPQIELRALVQGGGQQDGLRSGSLDACGILAFCRAVRLACEEQSRVAARVAGLREQLVAGLGALHDRFHKPIDVQMVSPPHGSPFICCFVLPEYQGAVLVRAMATHGVHVGTGSACAAQSRRPSRILTAMGWAPPMAFGALRVSFGRQNDEADIARLLAVLQQVLADY